MTRSQRISMSSLTALTLRGDRKTSGRRTDPVPQLTCIGKACRKYQPDVVQCVKMGDDGAGGLEWKCDAELPSTLRFGSVEVSCEGWDSPSDPNILRNSCGLTYNLVEVPQAFESSDSPFQQRSPSYNGFSSFSWLNALSTILALYGIYLLANALFPRVFRTIRSAFRSTFGSGSSGGGGWGGGGGGGSSGGGGGWGGGPGHGGGPPPPPYSKTYGETAGQSESWRPGFWSGLAAGAAALQGASYLRGNAQPAMYGGSPYRTRNAGWGIRDDYEDNRGVGGSGSWGRGGGTGASASSGSMRSSSGFGGTRNR